MENTNPLNGDFCIIPSEYFRKLMENKPIVQRRTNNFDFSVIFFIFFFFMLLLSIPSMFITENTFKTQPINDFIDIKEIIREVVLEEKEKCKKLSCENQPETQPVM